MNKVIIKTRNKVNKVKGLLRKNNGWGIAELLALMVGIVVVVVILAPSIKLFSSGVMNALNDWWALAQAQLFSA